MLISRIDCKIKNPAILVTGCFNAICEYTLVLTFPEPSTFRISSAAPYFLSIFWNVVCEIAEIIVTTSSLIVVIIFVFQY